MNHPKNTSTQEMPPDAIKLAIREEVERRFDMPPASFVERIEAEVEKRVEHRVKQYKVLAGVVIALAGIFVVVLWKTTPATIRETVTKQLAEQEVIKARDRILVVKTKAEEADRIVADMTISMKTNQDWYLSRLDELKRQDNVLLIDDLPKLFVSQTVTNLVDGRKIVLEYEPIIETIKFPPLPSIITFDQMGRLEGKTIILTNNAVSLFQTISNPDNLKSGAIRVEYMRKSLH